MQPNSPFRFEVCVDTAHGIDCCQSDVDRIELCSALSVGGLTPSYGLIQHARKSKTPIHVMIRPRSGDFDFTQAEVATCLDDIAAIKDAGLAGVVVGASSDDTLDLATLKQMARAADGLEVTLHRVIDRVADPLLAVEQAIDLGFARILTSGGALKAVDGLPLLKQMQSVAAGRIEVMVGSGVSASNVDLIWQQTGITAFHGSCSRAVTDSVTASNLGFAPVPRAVIDRTKVAALRQAIDSLPQG